MKPKQPAQDAEDLTRADYDADDFFERSLDHLCVAGFDGFLKRVNPSWTRTLGWTREELLARPTIDFVHPDDRAPTLAAREDLRAGNALTGLVNRYLCKDGSYRWLEWRSVSDPERKVVYAAARDVTETKRAEERRFEERVSGEKTQKQAFLADRMASVGTLAAGTAHEINNPLTYVLANVTLLCEALARFQSSEVPPDAETLGELVEIAADAKVGCERIGKIVSGLKTFAFSDGERRAPLDVKAALRFAIAFTSIEIRDRARLSEHYEATPLVQADESRLAQVFVNLLLNASQALSQGSEGHEIRISAFTDDAGRAVVEIRDTGVGIPIALHSRIFDPFYTTKGVGAGTGLGLSIAHNIVSGLGGELSMSSEVGKGSTFRVTLPPATAERVRTSGIVIHKARTHRASVLIVDDEVAVGTAIRRLLGEHDVVAVTSAKAALELLASGKKFDLILSDLMMPEMSGMDLYDEIANRFPDELPRIVFVSGGAFTAQARSFLDRVENRRLEKPFDAASLRELVAIYRQS